MFMEQAVGPNVGAIPSSFQQLLRIYYSFSDQIGARKRIKKGTNFPLDRAFLAGFLVVPAFLLSESLFAAFLGDII